MPNLTIHTLPKVGHNGHLYITEVDLTADPPEGIDKNDKVVLFVFDGNATGFLLENIGLTALDDSDTDISDEVSFVGSELTGEDGGAVYAATLRPPSGGGEGSIEIQVPEDTVSEDNPETTLTVTYSDEFPEAVRSSLFFADDAGDAYDQIVSIDSEKIYLRHDDEIHVYDWGGVQDTSATVTLTAAGAALRLNADAYLARNALKLVGEQGGIDYESADILEGSVSANLQSIALTEDGRLLVADSVSGTRRIRQIPIEDVHAGIINDDDLSNETYQDITPSDGDLGDLPNATWYLASDVNTLYVEPRSTADHYIRVYDAGTSAIVHRRIPMSADFITYASLSLFVFRNRLFRYTTNDELQYIELDEWRTPEPLGKIHPIQVTPGQRIDLKKFVKYAF